MFYIEIFFVNKIKVIFITLRSNNVLVMNKKSQGCILIKYDNYCAIFKFIQIKLNL